MILEKIMMGKSCFFGSISGFKCNVGSVNPNEAPMLAKIVEFVALPPVEERVPENLVVVVPKRLL